MGEVFRNILGASFQGSVLILAVLLLRPLLKKAPKRFTCLLWILVGLRLLLPLHIESEFSLQPDVPSFEPVQQQQEIVPMQPETEQQVPVKPENVDIPGNDNTQYPVSGNRVVNENQAVIDWSAIATIIWLAAAAGLGIYCLVSYLRLKYRVREAVLLEYGIWESDRIDTAFILGYLLPRIYLPMHMDERNKRLILEHERSHLRNGDHWVKLIGFVALAVHWFNPLVWVAYILLCRDLEMACDERVIRSMGLEERKRYSAALLSCSSNRAHFAACPVAFGEKPVKKRILAVLHYRKPGFWITLIALIAVIAVALFFLTSPVEKLDPLTLEDWGVTMSAEDAHAGGVTVKYVLPEKTDGNFMLHMGDWVLQVEIDGKWVDVPMLPQKEPITPWNGKVKTLFPDDGTHRMELDWLTVYGEMQPGSYRIRGTLTLNQGGYGYEKDFYAAFRIWDSEDQQISSEAWEQECRRVLEKIQSSDSYHIRMRGEFEGELLLDDWNQVSYWKYGENWLMILENQDSGELDGVWYDGIYGDLCLNGEYFSGYMSKQQMIWNQHEHLDPPELWLASFDFKEKDADAISREDTDEGYVIRLIVYEQSDSPGLEYDAYYVDFHFDWDGNFRCAVQRIQATGSLMSETEAESMVLTMYAFECGEEAFNAVVDLYKSDGLMASE